MFDKMTLFRSAMSMAQHAGLKQAIVSQNVANADTPGYSPRTVADFGDLVDRNRPKNQSFQLKSTHHAHLQISPTVTTYSAVARANHEPSGNGVTLESEILHSVDAKRQHDRALAIYRASLALIRNTLSKQ